MREVEADDIPWASSFGSLWVVVSFSFRVFLVLLLLLLLLFPDRALFAPLFELGYKTHSNIFTSSGSGMAEFPRVDWVENFGNGAVLVVFAVLFLCLILVLVLVLVCIPILILSLILRRRSGSRVYISNIPLYLWILLMQLILWIIARRKHIPTFMLDD